MRIVLIAAVFFHISILASAEEPTSRFEWIPGLAVLGIVATDVAPIQAIGPVASLKGQYVFNDAVALGLKVGGGYLVGPSPSFVPEFAGSFSINIHGSLWLGLEFPMLPALTVGVGDEEFSIFFLPLYSGSFRLTTISVGWGHKF